MIKMSRQQNTILMNSTVHGVAVGYLVVSFRKASPLTSFWSNVAMIKAVAKRAKALEAALPVQANYAEILQQAKNEVYSPRYDLTRALSTVIHSITQEAETMTAGQAWDMLLNGAGVSVQTGKNIKPIICQEKRRKIAVKFIQKLADIAK